MLLYNTGSWTAFDFIQEVPGQHVLFNTGPNKQATLYQNNRVSMLILDLDQQDTLYQNNRQNAAI